jgi:uncharacterized metal-binding protein
MAKMDVKLDRMSPTLLPLPIVYSCSGCSSAAQMANYMAVRLDRSGVAEMSCIAGVGGDVPTLLKVAQSGRPIIAIDGCPLQCVKHTLARHTIEATMSVLLSDSGVKRLAHADFDQAKADEILADLVGELPGYLSGKSTGYIERTG